MWSFMGDFYFIHFTEIEFKSYFSFDNSHLLANITWIGIGLFHKLNYDYERNSIEIYEKYVTFRYWKYFIFEKILFLICLPTVV